MMKSLEQWFEEYSLSHQNDTNKKIHYICVPLIFFAVIGLLVSLPANFFSGLHPFVNNWGFVALVFVSLFYFRLSVAMGFKMLVFTSICLAVNLVLATYFSVGLFSVIVFVIGWIGQFYGHKVEGVKPSFFKDLQFLLIGPAWVINAVFKIG